MTPEERDYKIVRNKQLLIALSKVAEWSFAIGCLYIIWKHYGF